jgi:hypothetical protein
MCSYIVIGGIAKILQAQKKNEAQILSKPKLARLFDNAYAG